MLCCKLYYFSFVANECLYSLLSKKLNYVLFESIIFGHKAFSLIWIPFITIYDHYDCKLVDPWYLDHISPWPGVSKDAFYIKMVVHYYQNTISLTNACIKWWQHNCEFIANLTTSCYLEILKHLAKMVYGWITSLAYFLIIPHTDPSHSVFPLYSNTS